MRQPILVLILALSAAQPVVAQAADTVYIGSRHSPVASGVIELFVPTAGFAYAGDWTRGFLPNALRISSGIVFGAMADGPEGDLCEGEGICTISAIAVIASSVWSIVGAVQTANDHNRRLSQAQARVLIAPGPTGGVSVTMRIPLRGLRSTPERLPS